MPSKMKLQLLQPIRLKGLILVGVLLGAPSLSMNQQFGSCWIFAMNLLYYFHGYRSTFHDFDEKSSLIFQRQLHCLHNVDFQHKMSSFEGGGMRQSYLELEPNCYYFPRKMMYDVVSPMDGQVHHRLLISLLDLFWEDIVSSTWLWMKLNPGW